MKPDPRMLRERIEALSDEELLQMLTGAPHQYIPDALAMAEEERAKRRLSVDKTAKMRDSGNESESSGFWESVKVGAESAREAMGPGVYRAAGIKVVCPACQNDQFESQPVLLNTRALTFFKLDWLNAAATTLACTNCGLIQWYKQAPEREAQA
jgi:predicted nucleic-acid-binding Zn-ribbon protein